MKQLIPYINFNGRCEEALHFYAQCFDNAEVDIQTFANGPMADLPEDAKHKVMHGELSADGIKLMASDGKPGGTMVVGDNHYLNLQLDSNDEQTALFDSLSEHGQVVMPLQITSWGSRFGMLIDQFQVQWMLNVIQKS